MAQTKSALALGGMHHCLFSQGVRSFFLTSDVPFHPIYSPPLEVGPTCWRKVAWSTWRGLRAVRSKPGGSAGLHRHHRVFSARADAGAVCVAKRLPSLPRQTLYESARRSTGPRRRPRQFADPSKLDPVDSGQLLVTNGVSLLQTI